MTSSERSVQGFGAFSGKAASLTLRPGRGLAWHDPATGPTPALAAHLTSDTSWTGLPSAVPVRNTTLSSGRRVFATIEHVMGALAGLGVWNASIQLDGPEVPILDGSAAAFVPLVKALPAGAPEPLTLREPLEVCKGDASIIATPLPPTEPLEYVYQLDYGPQSPLRPQQATWRGEAADFEANIAPARTFSLRQEAEMARSVGLFRHLTPADLLVIGDDGRPIQNDWRFEHEPARHKLLDLIGDLALLGRPLHARVVASRSGHALTHEFCRRVLAQHA